MVNLSANEVAALSKLAARGAGYPWGLCDEASAAVRWLSSYGLAGAASLTKLCTFVDGQTLQQITPVINGSQWDGCGDSLCPLICGSALSDRSNLLRGHWQVTIEKVYAPLLLIPFASQISAHNQIAMRLSWADLIIDCHGDIVTANRDVGHVDLQSLNHSLTESVTLCGGQTLAGQAAHWQRNPAARVALTAESLDQLKMFAHRTYAPSTEQSRLRGAGAGESDND